jgi:hypothetical protein
MALIYKIYDDGSISSDGYLFHDKEEFGKYCDYKEMCDEYWQKQEEIEREDRLMELEEKIRNFEI